MTNTFAKLLALFACAAISACSTPQKVEFVTQTVKLAGFPGGFETDLWRETNSPAGPPCELLADGRKKCYLPNFLLVGPDWGTQVGLSPNNHYIVLSQKSANLVDLEFYFDYHSPVREAHSPGIEFTYFLKNENNAVVGYAKYHAWRACGANNIHRLGLAVQDNIDAVKGTLYVQVHALYRTQVNWC